MGGRVKVDTYYEQNNYHRWESETECVLWIAEFNYNEYYVLKL